MRIVNNRIYIARGETPTYSAAVIDKDTGAPLIVDAGMTDDHKRTMVIEFVVRDSAYSRDDDFKLRYYLMLEEDVTYHVFDDDVIKDYPGTPTFPNGTPVWDNTPPSAGNENRLHRYSNRGDNFYCYYSNGSWKDYEFAFDVTFTYDETSVMEPKTYQYEIALLGGDLKNAYEPHESPIKVIYKKPLLGLTDFVVEGSISE